MTHKNTKITRDVYKFIKELKMAKMKAKEIIPVVWKEYDLNLSISTINAIGRSRNYKNYRELVRHTPDPQVRTVIRVVTLPLTQPKWYETVPVIRTWLRWIGGNR